MVLEHGSGLVIPSKRFDVFGRLYTRFTLEPAPAEPGSPVGVAKVIVPTTDADALLREPRATAGVTAVSGTGGLTIFTVPAGFKGRIFSISGQISTGTWTYSRIFIGDVSEGGVEAIISIFTPLTDTALLIPGGFPVDEFDFVGLEINSHSVSGNLSHSVMFDREADF